MSKEKSLLVVDDDYQVCLLLESILCGEGYNVTTVQSVSEARKMLNQKHFDLLLTDMHLGDDYGLDLIVHVQKKYPSMGIVVVTIVDNTLEAKKILSYGIYGYIVKPFNKSTVIITVENALRRHYLELTNHASKRQIESQLSIIMNHLHIGLLLIDSDMNIVQVNDQIHHWFPEITGDSSLDFLEKSCIERADEFECTGMVVDAIASGFSFIMEKQFKTAQGSREMQLVFLPVELPESGTENSGVVMIEDITEKLRENRERDKSQKLEAIGQLAAGIAHEINSPVQFIGDNIGFISDSLTTIFESYSGIEKIFNHIEDGETRKHLQQELHTLLEEHDIDYFQDELPLAIEQSRDGVNRIARIVKAMRELSHPGSEEQVLTNINHGLETTITVSRNEWKYDADVVTELDPNLQSISCYPDDLNQVFLNLIVNAAHAISERVENKEIDRGTITVKTEGKDDCVVVTIADNGGGIDQEIQEKVFEPFFTTKEIGKGTGQGLGIAKRIVTEKHCGEISFTSSKGEGTTFSITLPVDGCEPASSRH